jgi:hypothetical protein
MSEETDRSRVGGYALAAVGAIVLVALLVQNVLQGRAITALEGDVAEMQTAMVVSRRDDAVKAIGTVASAAKHPAKKGKRRASREPGEGPRKGGKAGKRRGDGEGRAPADDDGDALPPTNP